MIYDCFLFYNELDLLDIRLNTHSTFVDRFILLEATYTFTGQEKELFFENAKNNDAFKPFLHKIEHIIIDKKLVDDPDPWAHEIALRKALGQGILNLKDDDIVIYSDADEIINPLISDSISHTYEHTRLEQRSYWYYLNCLGSKMEMRSAAFLRGKDFVDVHEIRRPLPNHRLKGSPWDIPNVIKGAGWHFTFMGGVECIKTKIAACSHQERNQKKYNSTKAIEDSIQGLTDLFGTKGVFWICPLDDLPIYVQENKDRFKHLIK